MANEEKSEQSSPDLLGHTPNTFMIVTYALTLVAAFGAVTQLWNRDFERFIILYSIKQLMYGLGVLTLVTIFSHFIQLFRFVLMFFIGYSKIAENIFYSVIIFTLFSVPIVAVSHFYCVSFWTIDQLATASGTPDPSLDISFQYGDKCIAVMGSMSVFANWCASLLNFFGDFILNFIRALPGIFLFSFGLLMFLFALRFLYRYFFESYPYRSVFYLALPLLCFIVIFFIAYFGQVYVIFPWGDFLESLLGQVTDLPSL